MATYRAPGVYVEEVPGARSITGVSTDIACFVGVTEKGEVDKPTLITSWNDYQDAFGGFMWNRYVPMAVYNFFTEGGAQCYVVNTGEDSDAVKAIAETTKTNAISIKFEAKSAGQWANSIQVGISTQPAEKWSNPVSFNVQVVQKPYGDASLTAASLSTVMLDRFIVSNKSEEVAPDAYPKSFYGTLNQIPPNSRVLEEFVGFTKNDLFGGEASNLARRIASTSLFLKAVVPEMSETSFKALTLPGPSIIQMSGGSGSATDGTYQNAFTSLDPILNFSTMAVPDAVNGTKYKVTGADNQWDWNPKNITVTDSEDAKTKTQSMLTKLEEWKRVFSVLDPPFGYDVQDMIGYKTGSGSSVGTPLNSTYGAIYYPWLQTADPFTGNKIWVPPSGQTLGRYAATDRAIGVWKSPAGIESGKILTATALARDITSAEQELLNPEGVDAIRSILNYGICVYGARTVSLNPEWRYVSVRRLAIYIEQSLFNALQWVVFEPNSPALWGRVTRDVTNFMTTTWQQGALFGTSAAEAFYVVCDASNNPPATRDEGYLYIDVGFAPVKPAEFVVIRLSQMTLTA